jgi:predicted nucleic acid-binding protein
MTHRLLDVSAASALEAVGRATRHEGHEFWPLDREVVAALRPFEDRLRGHRQWTDALLLWQAAEHDGVLATFDAGLKELAGREWGRRVLLLK